MELRNMASCHHPRHREGPVLMVVNIATLELIIIGVFKLASRMYKSLKNKFLPLMRKIRVSKDTFTHMQVEAYHDP